MKLPKTYHAQPINNDAEIEPIDWEAELQQLKAEAEAQIQRENQEREAARLKAQDRHQSGQISPVDAFNEQNPLESILRNYGYKQSGKRWLSPESESGQAGVILSSDGRKWISAHGCDADKGRPINNGTMGDAFDLYCFYVWGNDRDSALKAVADAITTPDGITISKHNQRLHMEQKAANERMEAFGDLSQTVRVVPPPRKAVLMNLSDFLARSSSLEWLVKGLLEDNTLSSVVGESGSGKSFFCIDIALCVASGRDFHGRRVKQGRVVYVAGEGHSGVGRRIKAWLQHYGLDQSEIPIHISKQAVSFVDQGELAALVSEIDALPTPPALIIVDTLARAITGADENSNTDMGAFIHHCDQIKHRFNSSLMLVHHTGNQEKSRGRGASCVKGALDTELLIVGRSGGFRVICNKVKDAEPFKPFQFELVSVDLGEVSEDGEPITSAIIQPCEVAEGEKQGAKKMNTKQRIVMDAFNYCAEHCPQEAPQIALDEQGQFCPRSWVKLEDLRKRAYDSGIAGADTGPDAKRKGFKRAFDDLQKADTLQVRGDLVGKGMIRQEDGAIPYAGLPKLPQEGCSAEEYTLASRGGE